MAKYKRQEENGARSVCIWENAFVKVSRSRRSCCVRTQTMDAERAQIREGAGPGPRMLPHTPPLPCFFSRRAPAGSLASQEGLRDFLWVTPSADGRRLYIPYLSQTRTISVPTTVMTGFLRPRRASCDTGQVTKKGEEMYLGTDPGIQRFHF